MSLTLGLGSAISGLMTAQKGLDLVSQNISNVNTPGYTRKDFNQVSNIVGGKGAGVLVGLPTRTIDQGLTRTILKEGGTLSNYQTLDQFYSRIQDLFGTPESQSSVSNIVAALGTELETLAVSPDQSTAQSSAVDAAVRTAQSLNTMTTQIQDLRVQVDRDLADNITSINSLLSDISNLNNKIVHELATSSGSANLEDQRDEAVKKLSTFLDVQSFARDNGAVVVYTNSGTPLVDNTAVTLTHSAVAETTAIQTMADSSFTGIMANGVDITADIRLGAMKGAVDLRDKVLPDMQATIDELARNMRDQLNQIHNRGTSYPEMPNKMTGTRTFIEPGTSTISMSAGDTAITLFNTDGSEFAKTTVRNVIPAINAGPAPTITAVAAAITSWLTGAATGTAPAWAGIAGSSATIDANGKFAIDLNNTSYSIAFRDEAVVAPAAWSATGATAQDATILFDQDGIAGLGVNSGTAFSGVNATAADIANAQPKGFANFLGLNDLYTTTRVNSTWDSKIKTATDTVGSVATLDFRVAAGTIGTIATVATDTIQTLAAKINLDPVLKLVVKAIVVPEGGGFRLRLSNIAGAEMQVTSTASTNLGLAPTETGAAAQLAVRSNIFDQPSKISRGTVLYNTDISEYYVSSGDNTTANQLADLATNPVPFRVAGNISGTNRTFSDYAATFLSLTASATTSNRTSLGYQATLQSSLEQKSANISAVNLDEELSKLMMYQHAYTAAAKVISTVQQMLDVLNSIIK